MRVFSEGINLYGLVTFSPCMDTTEHCWLEHPSSTYFLVLFGILAVVWLFYGVLGIFALLATR